MRARGNRRALWFGMAALVACGALAGCDVQQENVLAPTDAFMIVRWDATFVPANSSVTITVELKKIDGTPAPEGTEVVLQATSGELDQRKLRTRNGQAAVSYRSGAATGTARITATSGSISAELSLRIGSAPPGSVSVITTPLVLPPGGGETEVLATVSAPNGALVSGAPVTFTTSAGTLSVTEVTTNDRGEARTMLRTTATATIRAAVVGIDAAAAVRVRLDVSVRVSATPSEPTAGEASTLAANVTWTDARPVSGRLRFFLGDGQVRDQGTITGNTTTSYTWANEGGYNVSAEFTDPDGFVTRETIRVTVRAKVVTPPPTPPTTTPPTAPPTNPSPGRGADQIDPREINWLHTDVSRWPITSTITDVTISRSEMCVDHTRAGRFPTSQFGTIQVEGNVWIIARINGRWYAATYDWLRPGQVCKGVTGDELGRDQIRIAPMDASWSGPRSGDTVGFMVSSRARDNVSAGEERTNIHVIRWP